MTEIKLKNNKSIKNKLIKLGTKNECAICGLKSTWNNKPITLQLDHIDGDNKNNLVSNLRLLCPNCHSQTKTYSGRNMAKRPNNSAKPDKKELKELYEIYSIKQISAIKQVSKRTVYDWLAYYDLPTNRFGRVLTCEQVRLIKNLYTKREDNNHTHRSLAKLFNTSKGVIQGVLENKKYKDC